MSITLGHKIKILRKAQNWAQQELADKVDVHVTHISRIESDQYTPSLELLKRLAKTFQVTTDYLLYDQDSASAKVDTSDTANNTKNKSTSTITNVKTAINITKAELQTGVVVERQSEEQKSDWQDNALYEKMKLLDKLDEEERKVIHSVIDAFLTKQQIWDLISKSKK
jgi:transcriptional regulator with XRE-family HTH domain